MQVPTKKAERLRFFLSLYAEAEARVPAKDYGSWLAQYKGSAELDGSLQAATTVRNITYELIEAQISTDIPSAVIRPVSWSQSRDRNAKAIERLCANIRLRQPFETYNDLCERRTYIYGGSVWLCEWGATEGEARVYNLSPDAFVGQPDICQVEQMEYCFLRFLYTKEELMRTFAVSAADAEQAACGGDTVQVLVCWYRNEKGCVSRFVFGETGVFSDDALSFPPLLQAEKPPKTTVNAKINAIIFFFIFPPFRYFRLG